MPNNKTKIKKIKKPPSIAAVDQIARGIRNALKEMFSDPWTKIVLARVSIAVSH